MSKPFKQQFSSPLITQKKTCPSQQTAEIEDKQSEGGKSESNSLNFAHSHSCSCILSLNLQNQTSCLLSCCCFSSSVFWNSPNTKHSLRSIYEKRVCLSFPSPSALLFSGTGGTQHSSHSFHHFSVVSTLCWLGVGRRRVEFDCEVEFKWNKPIKSFLIKPFDPIFKSQQSEFMNLETLWKAEVWTKAN